MYAIVEIAGKQYKVANDDTIEVDALTGKKGTVTFDTVLLYAQDAKTVEVGNPYVSGASVKAEIVEHKKGDKVEVFKMKPKKRYQRKQGHRRHLTVLSIKDISRKAAQATKKKAAAKKSTTKSTKKKTTTKKNKTTSKTTKAKKK
ncbi:50S ribosomal protein L21 [Candidatus Peregrinibacteria bacterium]|nr:50S ribosomal protein L21 [Candidatus Peregrinibacteria bacterium]